MPDPRMMLQAFQSLMQDPHAMQAMMQGAQQMGIPPQMLQQLMSGGGGGPPGGGMMQGPGGGPQAMPPDMGGAGPSGEGEMPPEAEGQGDPEQMASQQIDQAGNTWDGVDAHTQNDIDRLKETHHQMRLLASTLNSVKALRRIPWRARAERFRRA
jgi:hypothetical protein